jgi:hypothetical protein
MEEQRGLQQLVTDYAGDSNRHAYGSLAARQSYGFFTDISDTDWNKKRTKALGATQYKYPLRPEVGWNDPSRWYLDNLLPNFACPSLERVGGLGDGAKWTCDPDRLPQNCLVYSYGSAGNYAFEEGLLSIRNCEIHVFDPGNYARPGDEAKGIYYHQWGLKSSYDTQRIDMSLVGRMLGDPLQPAFQLVSKMRTYPETLKLLGHESRTIDILKIDCEKCEW